MGVREGRSGGSPRCATPPSYPLPSWGSVFDLFRLLSVSSPRVSPPLFCMSSTPPPPSFVYAAIVGHDGTTWACSPGYTVLPEEAKSLAALLGSNSLDPITGPGFSVAGQRYAFTRGEVDDDEGGVVRFCGWPPVGGASLSRTRFFGVGGGEVRPAQACVCGRGGGVCVWREALVSRVGWMAPAGASPRQPVVLAGRQRLGGGGRERLGEARMGGGVAAHGHRPRGIPSDVGGGDCRGSVRPG